MAGWPSRFWTFVLLGWSLCAGPLRAAEDPGPSSLDLIPDSALVALSVPDLNAAWKKAQTSRLAELYRRPEMQEFLAPILGKLRAAYEALRNREGRLPAPADA